MIRSISKNGGGVINPSESSPGDICLYDRNNDSLIIVKGDIWNSDLYPKENYYPVGVVVVPGTHNVYGDGSCGVISLKNMSLTSPTNGSAIEDISPQNNINMKLGEKSLSYGYKSAVPYVGNSKNAGDVNSTILGPTTSGILPSDNFNYMQCPHDINAYYSRGGDYIWYAPSPYFTSGDSNPGYSSELEDTTLGNMLSDFDGSYNTTAFLNLRGDRDYSSWKPNAYNNLASDYPAISCCDMFYTSGTKQGDWYLPAMGELGYVMARLKIINESISKLIDVYGELCGITIFGSFWSSTMHSSNNICKLSITNGTPGPSSPQSSYYARAFIRILTDNNDR